jgi:hypothetical protein
MEITDDNREMFEVFCHMHPLEAYDLNSEEFIKYCKVLNPEATDEIIIACIELLKETE